MTTTFEPKPENFDLYILSTHENWHLVTWKDENNIPVQHEVFLIYTGEENIYKNTSEKFLYLNNKKFLGKGYEFFLFNEPEIGCRVSIENGWSLTNEDQQDEFLKSILKIVDPNSRIGI
jgi:hypothetical protein